MKGGKGLEVVLTHLYAQAEKGRPLAGGPDGEILARLSPLGQRPLYKSISAELNKGRALSEILASLPRFPAYLAELIKKGEETGELAGALRLTLHHFPLFSKFRLYLNGLFLYILMVGLFLAGFLIFTAFEFQETYRVITSNILSDYPGLTMLGFLAGQRYTILAAVVIVLAAVILVRPANRRDLMGPVARRIPLVRRNYLKLVSLELGTLYQYHLEVGQPPEQALAEGVKAAGDNMLSRGIRQAIGGLEKGDDIAQVLSSREHLAQEPVVEAISLGLASGREKQLIAGHNRLVFDYLASHLTGDMKALFSYCVAGCGLLVGLAVVYVFTAIIRVYDWSFY